MTICPHCETKNIKGADACEQCGQALAHLPSNAIGVERHLRRDRLKVLHPTTTVTTVSLDTPVGAVVQLLADRSMGCVMVVDQDKLAGIFSERDALLKLNTRVRELKDRPVSDFMTRVPQSLDVEAKIVFAIHRMDVGSYRHVPITDAEGRPVAIISARSILHYLHRVLTEV